MAGEDPDDQWAARRARLDARLGEHRKREDAKVQEESRAGGMRGMAQGLKIASEFVAGIAVGAFIGYGIDLFLGTRPFGLIVFLMFGFAAGVLNVVRSASEAPKDGDTT